MMPGILLAMCMLSLCSTNTLAQDPFCMNLRPISRLDERWPFFSRSSGLDDRNLRYNTHAADGGHLLEYAPGLEMCGGRYPIWRKELRHNVSVVCVENENSTCAREMEIETRICDGFETYVLSTDVENSVFCFQPNFCRFNPCQNGGTCVNERSGYRCDCPTGYLGPTCQGDPCHNYNILPDMELRSPSNTVPHSYNDTFAPGWYEAPQGWTMTTTDPDFTCGTEFSLYTLATEGDLMLICETFFFPGQCYLPFIVRTVTCPREKTLYGLFFINSLVTYCFECTPYPLDLLIMEDVSSSVMKQDYSKMKNFAMEVVGGLDISPQGTNVAYMSVSKEAQIGFHLNAYTNHSDVLRAMAAQHGTGGRTVLGDGVKLAASDVFTPNNGGRPDATNVVLIFTDGRNNGGLSIDSTFQQLAAEADVFVVTVTSHVDQVAVRRLSSGYNHIRSIDDEDALTWAKDAVTPCKRYKI